MTVQIAPSRARGTVATPPSKSFAHRALICAALAHGTSTVRGIAESEDMLATLDCVRALGAEVRLKDGVATICGGIRSASLMYDSRQKVIDDVKKCIDDAGAGGGYIFRTSAGIDFAKKENVEAMFDTLYTYGAKASC